MTPQEAAARVRAGAGLFELPARGLLAVAGSDRIRWLNGMISNDVARLVPGPETSGCYAVLLTAQGRIVADLHVLLRPDELWLELPKAQVALVRERLAKLIIADDVRLVERSSEIGRLGLEGPLAPRLLGELLSPRDAQGVVALSPDACSDARIANVSVVVGAFGWTGERAFQLFVPGPPAALQAVREALTRTGNAGSFLPADDSVLEILRVEAGVPKLGAELSEEVLPPEARLERAISYTKGCYTGQEIIARVRSRGQVAHLLVGIAAEGQVALQRGAAIEVAGEVVGEATSAVLSPTAGAIALAFVRRAHAAPGTRVTVEGRSARVAALPFAPPFAFPSPPAAA